MECSIVDTFHKIDSVISLSHCIKMYNQYENSRPQVSFTNLTLEQNSSGALFWMENYYLSEMIHALRLFYTERWDVV